MQNKFICCLLLIIIIFSSVLIYKIDATPKYSEEKYNKVYKEYEQIINTSQNAETMQNISMGDSASQTVIMQNSTGTRYSTIGIINIPDINVSYPIINDCTAENLNIAPTKLLGPTINTVGNLVIVGHNNWNKEFFSNLHKLKKNDIVELIDTKGKKLSYKVYEKSEIKQDDFSCLEQDTNGKIELTLITCIKYHKTKRLVIKCVAIN